MIEYISYFIGIQNIIIPKSLNKQIDPKFKLTLNSLDEFWNSFVCYQSQDYNIPSIISLSKMFFLWY